MSLPPGRYEGKDLVVWGDPKKLDEGNMNGGEWLCSSQSFCKHGSFAGVLPHAQLGIGPAANSQHARLLAVASMQAGNPTLPA